MKLPKRVVIALMGFLCTLNVVLRYPVEPHEIGVDSFFIHNLAVNVVKDGSAEWVTNPLALFGWYPLSYPSAGPFLLSGFSDLGGVNVEAAILFFSLMLGPLGVLCAFLMAREFRRDELFALAVSFIYGLAPRYLAFTLWSASMRSLFMVLMPAFLWILLRTQREPKLKNCGLVVGLFMVLAATHRLAALLAVVVGAMLAALLVLVVVRILHVQIPRAVLSKPYRIASPYLALGAFAIIAGTMLFGTGLLNEYSVGELAVGDSKQVQLVNFGVSLARSVGLSLLFALAGIFVVVRLRNKSSREPFLLLAFLGLTPTLFLRQYTGFYILPFIALLGALAFLGISSSKRRTFRRVAIPVLLAASFAFSAMVLNYEVDHTSILTTATYTTATYVQDRFGGSVVMSNDGLLGVRVAAVSGSPYLPVGGAGTTFQSPELLAYRFFSAEEVDARVVRGSLQDLTLDSDSLWVALGIQAQADWVQMMQSPFDDKGAVFDRYHPTYYMENKLLGPVFFSFGNFYPSEFATTAHAGAYMIYDSSTEAMWFVEAPRH